LYSLFVLDRIFYWTRHSLPMGPSLGHCYKWKNNL